jgi:hypothetical protein
MSVVIIAYPPSGGGNHLKNMLCLDNSFVNSADLNIDIYVNGEREVHSTDGRNMQEFRMQAAETASGDYILHGHFGELAPWRNRINAIGDKKWILISFDTNRDRALLNERQRRLGQWGHEYYLNEEQPYLYQPEFYQSYFTGQAEHIYNIAIDNLWNPSLEQSRIIQQLNVFLNKNIDQAQAQFLHSHWHTNNNIIDYY